MVRRVSDRVGLGLTLKLALAAEDVGTINEETWKKALSAHPEFSPHYEAAKGKFLEFAMRRLAAADELANLRWLLERRHSDLFARPEPAGPILTVNQSVALGIPEDVVQRAREIAAETGTEKRREDSERRTPNGPSRTGQSRGPSPKPHGK